MSLQVWLPLVRDLSNQGLSSASPAFNANNSSIVANGKLGNCLKTTAVGEIDTNCNVDINTSSLSFGGWYKFNKAEIQAVIDTKTYTSTNKTSTGNLIGNTSYGGIGLIFTTNDLYANNKVLTNLYAFSTLRTATVNQATTGKTLDFDVWTHLFTVWDRDALTISFYVNGELFNSRSVSTFSDATTRNLFINYIHVYGGNAVAISPPSYVNDIRIYDHALSLKEIKLLSQGLVAHYTLGDSYLEGTTNLCITSDCLSSTCYNGATGKYGYGSNTDIYKTTGIFNGKFCTKVYMGTSGNSARPYPYVTNMFVSNGTNQPKNKTISFDYYGTIGTYINPYKLGSGSATCDWRNNVTTIKSGTFTNSGAIPVVSNMWNHISFTLTGTTDANAEWGYIILGDTHTSDTSNYWLFANFQIEAKDHETGYAGVGGTRNETTVYDCSGYNNHMLAVNAPTIAPETARYSVSTHFNNGQYIVANENSNTGWLPTDSITVNLWTYITTWGNPISCTEGGGWNFEDAGGSSGIRFPIYVKDVGYVYKNSGVATSGLLNGWHMLTGTFDKTESKIYIDGDLKGTATASTSNIIQYSSARLCISAEAQGTTPASSTMVGNISDVRIYATPLSADDIKELYQVGQSISKNKSLFAYELNEPANGELMNVKYTSGYSIHNESSPWTSFNSDGEATFTANSQSIGSAYVPVNPTNKTYYYDMMISVNAGNQFYVGWERYDKDKTPRSNQACVYVYAGKPSADVVKQRIRGTVDLSTDGVNPCAFIALRILNGWTGTTSGVTGQATIHYLSLREVDNAVGFHTSFGKNGIATTDLFLDKNGIGDIEKTGIINMTNFIET